MSRILDAQRELEKVIMEEIGVKADIDVYIHTHEYGDNKHLCDDVFLAETSQKLADELGVKAVYVESGNTKWFGCQGKGIDYAVFGRDIS